MPPVQKAFKNGIDLIANSAGKHVLFEAGQGRRAVLTFQVAGNK